MVSNYSAWAIPAIEVVEAFGGFGGLKILGLGISSGFGVRVDGLKFQGLGSSG